MAKLTIERFLKEPMLISGVSKRDNKPYSFWGTMFIAEDKLIKMNGDKEQIEPLKVGSVVEGTLKEDPYTKDGETKMSYKLVQSPVTKLQEELEDLRARVEVLEDAVFSAGKSETSGTKETVSDEEPMMEEIDVDDIPF